MLLLMEEDISYKKLFVFLKHLVRNLIDCIDFSFLVLKPEVLEVYQTSTDSFETVQIDVIMPYLLLAKQTNLQEELNQI
jgi:hypothetical protein